MNKNVDGREQYFIGSATGDQRGLASPLLIIGAVVLTAIGLLLLNNKLDNRPDESGFKSKISQNKPSSIPSSTPTPNAAPNSQVKGDSASEVPVSAPTTDPDPIVNCQSEKCGDRQVRSSVCASSTCCGVGEAWVWMNSVEDCRKAQEGAVSDYHYVPVPLNYHYVCSDGKCVKVEGEGVDECYFDGSCYHKECKAGACVTVNDPGGDLCYGDYSCSHYKCVDDKCMRVEGAGVDGCYIDSDCGPSQQELQQLYEEFESAVKQCKNEVNSYYNDRVNNCHNQFGGSSAEEACEYACNKERDKTLKKCEQDPYSF